jgi:2-polyprenyl-3-methyl-5-hydroxy-6-metoxy-1,4-benzoquinol methylase
MSDWYSKEWEDVGRTDAYYGVLAHPEYHAGAITDDGRREFFATGERDVAETLAVLRQLAGPSFVDRRIVDFGCGVGRLTMPLARVADRVVGIDASESMLAETRTNCAQAGISNVELALSRPGLPTVTGPFDIVHSFIVFQHIPPAAGYELAATLLDRLAPRGGGMLHFTFARQTSPLRRAVQVVRRSSKVLHRMVNVAQGRPFAAPLIAMFEYDLNRLLQMLQERGFGRVEARLTDHAGHLGAQLFFWRDR